MCTQVPSLVSCLDTFCKKIVPFILTYPACPQSFLSFSGLFFLPVLKLSGSSLCFTCHRPHLLQRWRKRGFCRHPKLNIHSFPPLLFNILSFESPGTNKYVMPEIHLKAGNKGLQMHRAGYSSYRFL